MTRERIAIKNGTTVALAAIILLVVLGLFGLFAWWAFTWSTHTLAWAIFIFGSLFGGLRVRAS